MDPNLLGKTCSFHGRNLIQSLVQEHGGEFLNIINHQCLSFNNEDKKFDKFSLKEKKQNKKITDFIAKKANLLFKSSDVYQQVVNQDNEQECFAVPPPIEHFMVIPEKERLEHFLQSVQRGELVIGVVSGKHESGLFITLLCVDSGKIKDIHDLNIRAFCSSSHIPSSSSAHEDLLDSYHVKDLVRASVLSANGSQITLSMIDRGNNSLGLMNEEDLPDHYRMTISSKGQNCEEVLRTIRQFSNPSSVSHLYNVTGLSCIRSRISLISALSGKKYPDEEYAKHLRKVQSSFWALKSVKTGVNFFKAGKKLEAFQFLNKALDIDEENVEALVARGALFANSNNFSRAVEDFEKACGLNPSHANGTKYFAETLVVLGKNCEAKNDIDGALNHYHKALTIKKNSIDAQKALESLENMQSLKKKQKEEDKQRMPPVAIVKPTTSKVERTSAVQKLQHLLKEEKGGKEKKRKPSSSSSSQSSSSDKSSDSSSSESSCESPRKTSRSISKKRNKHKAKYFSSKGDHKRLSKERQSRAHRSSSKLTSSKKHKRSPSFSSTSSDSSEKHKSKRQKRYESSSSTSRHSSSDDHRRHRYKHKRRKSGRSRRYSSYSSDSDYKKRKSSSYERRDSYSESHSRSSSASEQSEDDNSYGDQHHSSKHHSKLVDLANEQPNNDSLKSSSKLVCEMENFLLKLKKKQIKK